VATGAGPWAEDTETAVTTSALGLILLTGATVVLAAIVAARVAHGIGLPGLLVFLGLGLALGEAGVGVRFDNAGLAQALGLSALVLILAEGGLTTNWAHARAAAPAALSLATVGVVVTINTLLQGPTLPWAARRLKVTAPAEPLAVDVEAAPLEALHADLLQAQIPPGSRLHGVEIFELRLPAQANVALIVRGGQGFVPAQTTTLQAGDRLLIVATAAVREETERRLRAVGRAGKLAGWFGEHGC
jgi:NhaP-type Na+/H+ and K+/H+ antiporter